MHRAFIVLHKDSHTSATRVHFLPTDLKRVHRARIVFLEESHHTPFSMHRAFMVLHKEYHRACIVRASRVHRLIKVLKRACNALPKELNRVHRACIVLLQEYHHTPFSMHRAFMVLHKESQVRASCVHRACIVFPGVFKRVHRFT